LITIELQINNTNIRPFQKNKVTLHYGNLLILDNLIDLYSLQSSLMWYLG